MRRPAASLSTVRTAVAVVAIVAAAASVAAAKDAEKPPPLPPVDTVELEQGRCMFGELESAGGCIVPPKLKKQVPPRYPETALAAREEGNVIMTATVDVKGKVGDVRVIMATPVGKGFEEAATAALQKWKYRPATIKDKPVAVLIQVTTEFRLEKPPAEDKHP